MSSHQFRVNAAAAPGEDANMKENQKNHFKKFRHTLAIIEDYGRYLNQYGPAQVLEWTTGPIRNRGVVFTHVCEDRWAATWAKAFISLLHEEEELHEASNGYRWRRLM